MNRNVTRGSRILITGCSTGLGRAATLKLAASGHSVMATVRRPEDAARLRRETADTSVRVTQLDIRDPDSVTAAVDDCRHQLGEIDVLINNAGVEVVGPVEATTDEDLRWQWETNVAGTFRMTRAVLPNMRQRRSGHIIFVSSLMGCTTRPFGAAYTASKYAVEGFAGSLRWEMMPFGVAVSILRPGRFPSALSHNQRRVSGTVPGDPYRSYADEYGNALRHVEPTDYRPEPAAFATVLADLVGHPDPPPAVSFGADTDTTLRLAAGRTDAEYEQEMLGRLRLDWRQRG